MLRTGFQLKTVNSHMTHSHATKDSQPLFIMGCQRSGTTLVSSILNSHPNISIYHESFLFHIFSRELKFYGDLSKHNNLRLLAIDLAFVIKSQAREIGKGKPAFSPSVEDILELSSEPSFNGLYTAIFKLYAYANEKSRGGDKTPENYQYLKTIKEGFPSSPIIYLIRDPRDVILSSQKIFGTSLEKAAYMWNEAYQTYSALSENAHLVKYELLVTEPETSLKQMCHYINEDYTESLLSFFKDTPDRFKNHRQDIRLLNSPISTKSIGNYQEIPVEKIKLIEQYCAEGMDAMGYTPSQSALSSRKPLRLKKQSQLTFILGQLRYYGTNLDRWKHGSVRWKIMLMARLRYFGQLKFFR